MNEDDIRAAMRRVGKEDREVKVRKTPFEEFEDALISALVSPSSFKTLRATNRLKLLVQYQANILHVQNVDEREKEAAAEGEAWVMSLSKKVKSAINCQMKEPLK